MDLGSDPIVERLVPDAGEPPDVIALVGFFELRGESARLYADEALTVWMEFSLQDVVERQRIPEERDALGGRSVIWVKGDVMRAARLAEGEHERLAATFLTGPIGAGILIPRTLEEAATRLTLIYSSLDCLRTYRGCPH